MFYIRVMSLCFSFCVNKRLCARIVHGTVEKKELSDKGDEEEEGPSRVALPVGSRSPEPLVERQGPAIDVGMSEEEWEKAI